MKYLFGLMLAFSSAAHATSFKVGTYSEFPYSNGIEARFGIISTPIEAKLKAGFLNSAFIRSGSSMLLATGAMSDNDAIVIDGAYQEGSYIEVALGMKLPQLHRRAYVNAGYSRIKGYGSLSAGDTIYFLSQGRGTISLGPLTESYRLGLEGEIHMLQATIGYEYPLTDYLNLTSEFSLRHGFSSDLKAEYGPILFKDVLSQKFDESQEDGLSAMPLLPSFLVGINYGLEL